MAEQAHTTAVTIRLAESSNSETIHAALHMIASSLHLDGKVKSTADEIRHWGFGQTPLFTVLLAECDGRFAGMSLFFPSFSTWRGQCGAYIQDFVVEPQYRGLGISQALLRATARHVRREMGGHYLRLSVDTENHRARRFYETMGLSWARSEAIHAAYDDVFAALAD